MMGHEHGLAMTEQQEQKRWGIERFLKAAREFIYGMVGLETVQVALKTRGSLEHIFILITMGDLLGVPILRPYYSLRILHYVVHRVDAWKHRMLREKDLTDVLG